MITPSYSLTATERVLPKLALDFTTASLDSRITFTRMTDATHPATYTNSSGAVVAATNNQPRFDYDPVTLVCKGLLIEESRTNNLLNSVFANAVAGTPGTAPTDWSNLVSTGTITSVTAGIYASGNAIRITNVGTRRAFFKSYAVSANTTYSYSLRVTVHSTQNVSWPRIQDCMNLAGGPSGSTITYLLNGASATSTTTIPNGQTSVVTAIIAVAATAGNVEVRWGLGIGSVIDADVTVQMPQFETGAFPTSYIPTTSAALTRNADVAVMTGTNFSDWFNTSEGAAVVQVLPSTISGTRPAIEFDDNTANQAITLRGVAADPQLFVVNGGATQATLDAGTITANAVYKLGGAWKSSSFAASVNGGGSVSQLSGTYPTVTQARLGSDGTNYLNGCLQNLRYWPQRITNAETQAFSK